MATQMLAGDPKESCRQLLRRHDDSGAEWQLGKTKVSSAGEAFLDLLADRHQRTSMVSGLLPLLPSLPLTSPPQVFLRESLERRLEKQRELEVLKAAMIIQAHVLGYMARWVCPGSPCPVHPPQLNPSWLRPQEAVQEAAGQRGGDPEELPRLLLEEEVPAPPPGRAHFPEAAPRADGPPGVRASQGGEEEEAGGGGAQEADGGGDGEVRRGSGGAPGSGRLNVRSGRDGTPSLAG